jgi:Zn-dependent M28 family amino/carboxypeptidase
MKKVTLFTFSLIVAIQLNGQHSFSTDKLMRDLKILSSDSLEGRKTDTEGSTKARAYIIDNLKKMGVASFGNTYDQPFAIGSGHGVNIAGVIPGKKKETIVISAHYDHLGIRNNMIYNGTDDNASGVAALLALAQYFQKNKPQHRLIIVFFDAEEIGLKGSAYFVDAVDLQKENVVLNVNLDMVSRSDKNELYACGTFHNAQLKDILFKTKTPDGIKLKFGHDDPAMGKDDWTRQSDQYNFHLKKVPFIYFGVEDHPDYHKAGDDFEKINPEFYANSTETILRTVKTLDSSSRNYMQ